MLSKLHRGGEAGALWGQDCWESGGRAGLSGPLSRIAGCTSPGPPEESLASSSLRVRRSLGWIRGGRSTLCLGEEQFRPGVGEASKGQTE